MANPVGTAGNPSQITNIPVSQPRPETEQARPDRAEEAREAEPQPSARNDRPDPDSNVGNNIDTSA